MKSIINFRATKPQKVDLPFDGEQTITFIGVCPLTGIRLYTSSGSNDPRGPLGNHAVHDYIAANNSSATYERGLSLAKREWK